MSFTPLRSSEHHPSSARSSISDLPAITITSPRNSITPLRADDATLRNSLDFDSHGSLDDLDIEDPLSRMYDGDSGFEPFSRKELGFISVSCIGVVMVPLLFLIVSQVQVSSFLEKLLITVLRIKLSYMSERLWGTENERMRWTLRYLMDSSLDA